MKTKMGLSRNETIASAIIGAIGITLIAVGTWGLSYEDGRKDEQLKFQKTMVEMLADLSEDENK